MGAKKKQFWNFIDSLEGDKVVWIIALLLMLFSILCMFSSTSRLLENNQSRLDIVKSQIILVGMGIVLLIICYNIKNIALIRWCSKWGFLISFVLLAVLLSRISTPFLKSIEINGARRIIQVAGFQVHVFEVVKVAMVMYLAWAMDARAKGSLKLFKDKDMLQKIFYIYGPALLTTIMIVPGSNSSALFIGAMMFITILLGGGEIKDLAVFALACVLTLGLCVAIYNISDGKVMGRIGTGISRIFESEDWEARVIESRVGSHEYSEALDKIRQPYSAKIAINEGKIFGKGPGQSTQRYVVPDISEDFMFSFIIEEYGLIGGIFIILLYMSLLARSSLIVRNCGKNDQFGKIAVAGLTLLIVFQAFMHIFVNTDIGPMTGQTLPLVSHGSSAFLCFSLAFGIILSISRIAAKRMEREQRNAEPLVELHEVEQAHEEGLGDLEAFENGENLNDIIDDDYGL